MVLQARRFWPHLAAISLLGLLATPLPLLTPLPLKIIIDSVLGSHPPPALLSAWLPASLVETTPGLLAVAVGLLIGVTLLTHFHSLGHALLQTYVAEGMVLDFRARLFRHVQQLSLAFHDARGSADSTYRIQYDAPSVQLLTIYGVIPLATSLATLGGLLYVSFRLDAQLALVALAVCPVLFVLIRVFSPRLRQRWRDVKVLESSANAVVHEVLGSMRVVKAFGREAAEHERYLGRSTKRMRELLRVSALQGIFDLGAGMTIAVGTAGLLYFGVLRVQSGVLTLGELTLMAAYVAALYEPLRSATKRLADLQSGLASAERAFALLDESPSVTERLHALPLARSMGAVRFEGVGFSYDGAHPTLRGVSFEAPPGSRIGIVGRTGAGKTTLISLLTRLYDVTEGRILLDGVDLRDYRLADLRNQFGIVLQEPVLFSTSIAENISYGRPDASDLEIVAAARAANAHDFIQALPDGYDTVVGERGMRLSGGERQRISLARAFLKNAPILILDEPTSAVDLATESGIMDALQRLMGGRTTFMIAHRTSTLSTCDVVLEIEGGQLVRRVQNEESATAVVA